jgi:hypothetical protein
MWALNRLAYIDYTIRELESLPEKDRAIREHISFCKKRRVFYMQLQRMQEDG